MWRNVLELSLVFCLCVLTATSGSAQEHKGVSNRNGLRLRSRKNLPQPDPYPEAFVVDFLTNVTRGQCYSNASPSGPSTIVGRLNYDWTQQAQRIDHGQGSHECLRFYQHEEGPCSLIFLPQGGMYRILWVPRKVDEHHKKNKNIREGDEKMTIAIHLEYFEIKSCCLDIPGLKTPSPDWATREHIASYNGVVYDSFSGCMSHEWIFGKPSENESFPREEEILSSPQSFSAPCPADSFHTSRQVADHANCENMAGRPILFSFPSVEGRQDYHYLLDTLVEYPMIPPSIFALPPGCDQRRACS